MSKLKEILENNVFCISEIEGDYEQVFDAMKEYAEWYAEQFRQKILDGCWTNDYGQTLISETELCKIKLPNYD